MGQCANLHSEKSDAQIRASVENIGLDWDGQRKRIERKEALNSTAVMMTVVAEDGKKREMTCLPIEVLNGW